MDFTAAGRRLRVCRSPEFTRAKRRGTGDTTVPAKVAMEELVGSDWVDRGTRADEVALLLKDILGMGLEQFIKVVLLPQGDFAAFLRGSPEERRSLLEKLFDTQRFTDVETWLVERRRETAAAVGAARGQLATNLLRVDDVLTHLDPGDDIVSPTWSDVPHPELRTELAGLVTAVESRANAALAAVEIARTESAVHHGAALTRHQETASVARARLRVLDEQSGVYEDASGAVALAERAGAVFGYIVALQSADRLREAAAAAVEDLRAPLALVLDHEADAAVMASLIDQVAIHGDALQQVTVQASRAKALAEESARHSRSAFLHDQASVGFAQQGTESEAHLASAGLAREAGVAALAEIPGLEAHYKRLCRVQQLLADQERSAQDLKTLQGQADSAHRVSLDARERLVDLRERRLAGMAAELASDLKADSPCPVCGSCAHPMPATTSDVVSPQDLRLAEARQTGAAEALSLVRSEVAAETARREARALELTADQPGLLAEDLPGAVVVATVAIAESRAAGAALPEAQGQVVTLTEDMERLRGLVEHAVEAKASSLALASSTLAQSQTADAEVESLLAGHRQSCSCRAGHHDDTEVAEVVSDHRETLARLRLLATGLQELATLDSSAREASFRLSTALQDKGFESMKQAQVALLPASRVAELTALLRAAEQQRAQATALLAQPDVVAALELPIPDMDALALAHALAATSLTDAGRLHTVSEQSQRDLRVLSGAVHHALADLGPAEQEARAVQELADCAAGNSADNALRMRLSSYVLAARLAEIATLANERLRTMTDGRYTLEYTDARAARGARSGLGLLVRDAWTGQPRETSSLSGGEAFMASLALALGLGDAVRAEAGGFDLQTLFVDEGFGTLDEESLEQVLAVLDTLREGGRAVGIVSHVTELRARIPQQLHVIKTQAGSRISVGDGVTPVA